MRTLSLSETLMYYDRPLLIAAQDQLGLNYVCLLMQSNSENDEFLCTPISKGRLGLLLLGELDIRSIFEEPETGELYIGVANQGNLDNIETNLVTSSANFVDVFPERGVFLDKQLSTDNRTVEES